MQPRVVLLMLVVVSLAGCLDPTEEMTEAGAEVPWIYDDPAQRPPPTLLEAPTYVRGEWWTYDVQIELGDQQDEVTVVAVDADEKHHFIGMPADAFSDIAILNHFPVQGEVVRDNLGIDMHGAFFPLLDFPLVDGKTWKAPLVSEATALVTVHDDTTAEVVFTGGLLPVRVLYDATVGAVTEYEVSGLGTATLTDHGFGHQGEVIVATDFWLNMWGSAAGAVTLGPEPLTATGLGVEAGRPVEEAGIPARDAGSYFLYVGNFDVLPANTPGTYAERTRLPDGTEQMIGRTPADGVGGTGLVGHTDDPGGTWVFQHVALGAGVAFTEIAVYNEARYVLERGA